MDRAPRELRLVPFHRPPAEHLHDRGVASDRSHRPLVAVLERLGRLARDAAGDRLARVLSRLECDRAQLGELLLRLRVRDDGDVTHDVDARVSGELEIRTDSDAVAPLQLDPERLDEAVALEACAPDEGVRGNAPSPEESVTRVGETDCTRARRS